MGLVQRKSLGSRHRWPPLFNTRGSGTGKELCALRSTSQIPSVHRAVYALNCGAIRWIFWNPKLFGHMKGSFQPGRFSDKQGAAAAADGGTLFLDEVCEMLPARKPSCCAFANLDRATCGRDATTR